MSQMRSLSSLFQELGNNPDQLAAFQANPRGFLDTLPLEEQSKLQKICKELVLGANVGDFPDGEPHIGGDFYVGTDDGGTIYQLFTTTKEPIHDLLSALPVAQTNSSSEYGRIEVKKTGTHGGEDDFKLRGDNASIEAVMHFQDEHGVVDTYHDANIKKLEFGITNKPRGPYLVLVEVNPIPGSNWIKCTLKANVDTTVHVSGDVHFNNDHPNQIRVTTHKREYRYQTTTSSGYIIFQAPGGYHRNSFTMD